MVAGWLLQLKVYLSIPMPIKKGKWEKSQGTCHSRLSLSKIFPLSPLPNYTFISLAIME